jgi:hypothetical protein
MSTNDKTNGYNALKVSKFDHSSTTPRATRWREWVVKLRYAFGSALGSALFVGQSDVRSSGPFELLVGSDLEPSP